MMIKAMLEQLVSGMGVSIQIFVITLVLSLPLGLLIALGRMSKNVILSSICKNLYFNYARNAIDVTIDGSLFWTLLSVWN